MDLFENLDLLAPHQWVLVLVLPAILAMYMGITIGEKSEEDRREFEKDDYLRSIDRLTGLYNEMHVRQRSMMREAVALYRRYRITRQLLAWSRNILSTYVDDSAALELASQIDKMTKGDPAMSKQFHDELELYLEPGETDKLS